MTSRLVNFVVSHMNARQAGFSIYRINPANLFYPTGSPVPAQGSAELATMEDVPLPPAEISYDWSSTPCQHRSMDFMAFGRNRDKIVGIDSVGSPFLYDLASRCMTLNISSMPQSVTKPVPVVVGDNGGLFVMSHIDPQFVALMDVFNPNSTHVDTAKAPKADWYWKPLQRPPFASRSSAENKISAYTVVGNSQIWVSVGSGTFFFDTRSGVWNKAGDWALPFRGRAEYVPEHNLWFGFSQNDKHICVSDLTAVSTVRPPVPQKVWQDLVWPEDWNLRFTDLLPLGSGKLCTARFFNTSVEAEDLDIPDKIDSFLVLAGVEVISREGRPWFIKHKSERYSLGHDLANPL